MMTYTRLWTRGFIIITTSALLLMLGCLEVKSKSGKDYFDCLASFIHHLLILVIKSRSESRLRLSYFQNFIIFSLIKWSGWLINNKYQQPLHFKKSIFSISAAAELKKIDFHRNW